MAKNILWIASWMLLQLLIQLPFKTETNLKKGKHRKHKKRNNYYIYIIYICWGRRGRFPFIFFSFASQIHCFIAVWTTLVHFWIWSLLNMSPKLIDGYGCMQIPMFLGYNARICSAQSVSTATPWWKTTYLSLDLLLRTTKKIFPILYMHIIYNILYIYIYIFTPGNINPGLKTLKFNRGGTNLNT